MFAAWLSNSASRSGSVPSRLLRVPKLTLHTIFNTLHDQTGYSSIYRETKLHRAVGRDAGRAVRSRPHSQELAMATGTVISQCGVKELDRSRLPGSARNFDESNVIGVELLTCWVC